MSYKADALLDMLPFSFQAKEKEKTGLFYEALLEELRFHFDNNKKYRTFCEKKSFNPYDFSGSIGDIPSVHVSVFKALGKELLSVSQNDLKFVLQSSATSGVPSSINVDKITARRQAKAMVRVVSDYIGNTRKPFLVMDVDPSGEFKQFLGARFSAVSGYLNYASQVGFFLKVNKDNKYFFDLNAIESFISSLNDTESSLVFGFTYLLYSKVVKPLFEQNIHFKLPTGSKIIHIGGWKKLEDEKVSQVEFNEKTATVFGIKSENVIDIYGFTEQMGLNYPTCLCGCKHVPLYSEVLVRDVVTRDIITDGREGLLEFVSPIPHSYPGNVILTDDIGLIENGVCPYGRVGTRFKVLGRLKQAEIRGCGDVLSSKLSFSSSRHEVKESNSSYRVEFFYDDSMLKGLEPKDSIKLIIKNLKSNISWLRQQPIDALIGLVSLVAKKWLNIFKENKTEQEIEGITFLASWCSVEHLTILMTEGLDGNRLYLDSFAPIIGNNIVSKKAVSRGLGCHWLAGNVQILGMFVLIEAILTKNVNLLKVSSRDNGVMASLLKAFKDVVFSSNSGYTICGNELLKTIALVYYNHSEHEIAKVMSEEADFRVAWGGADAVSTVIRYPKKYDTEDIIMGPKVSFGVIAKEVITDEQQVKKLARKIAIDASVFDQTGCASLHNLYIENNDVVSPMQFVHYISNAMNIVAKQYPVPARSSEQLALVHSAREIFDFKGVVQGSKDLAWTVIFDPENELCKPTYSRVLYVHSVENIMETLKFIDDSIQSIGLAVNAEKRVQYAELAGEKGAVRFPVFGRMLNFDSPWDGMYLMDKMVRWVSLGGPVV